MMLISVITASRRRAGVLCLNHEDGTTLKVSFAQHTEVYICGVCEMLLPVYVNSLR